MTFGRKNPHKLVAFADKKSFASSIFPGHRDKWEMEYGV